MSILRDENDKRVALMVQLAKLIISRVNNRSSIISINGLKGQEDAMIEAILGNYYKDLLRDKLKTKPDTKGIIKFKPDSWMNLVDMDRYNPNMSSFNITPVNDELVNKIVNRLSSEIDMYKNIIDGEIKPTIEAVNKYKQAIKPAESLTDLFSVKTIGTPDTLQLLKDKGYLSRNSVVGFTDNFSSAIDNIRLDLSINSIDNDPEVLLSLKDDFSEDDLDVIYEEIEDILSNDVVKSLGALNVDNIGTVTVLGAIIGSRLRKAELSSGLYKELNSLVHVLDNITTKLMNRLDSYSKTKQLIIGIKNGNEHTDIYVLEDVYKEFISNKGSIKSLVGAYLSNLVSPDVKAIKNIFVTTLVKLSDVTIKKAMLEELADGYNKQILITRHNEDISKLRTYFIFGILDSGVTDHTDFEKEEIRKYIYGLSISELGDVEKVVINVFRYFKHKNTNLEIFLNAVEDGKYMLGKNTNPKMAVGYAAMKIATLYLSTQTDLV